MRDPTRGGLASVANEITLATGLGIRLFEDKIPVRRDVEAACELLGLDPLYLACEGRAVIIVERSKAKEVVGFLRKKGARAQTVVEESLEMREHLLFSRIFFVYHG